MLKNNKQRTLRDYDADLIALVDCSAVLWKVHGVSIGRVLEYLVHKFMGENFEIRKKL